MDDKMTAVLDAYHERIREERSTPREMPPGGRDGGQDQRMRAVGPDTGQLINILARSLEAPTILELGTSFGYSGIWLADAARAAGGRLITMELHDYKSAYAQQMAVTAGLADYIDFKVGECRADDRRVAGQTGLRAGRSLEGPLRALPGGLLSQAQSGRAHRRRQYAASGQRGCNTNRLMS
jgi:predicted O-methyltransferase YrrM